MTKLCQCPECGNTSFLMVMKDEMVVKIYCTNLLCEWSKTVEGWTDVRDGDTTD